MGADVVGPVGAADFGAAIGVGAAEGVMLLTPGSSNLMGEVAACFISAFDDKARS